MTRSRRRRLERRGRPRKAAAKRRETTAAARRGEPDRGTAQLRRRKRQATTREDLEVSPIAVLFGRGLIDATQYDTLGQVADWLRRLARNLGPKSDAVAGLWAALTGAAISAQGNVPVAVGPAADHSRYMLRRMLRRLDGSRELVLQLAESRPAPLVIRALEGRITRADEIALDRLRHDLDRVAGRTVRAIP
jgi:hypothetical protein